MRIALVGTGRTGSAVGELAGRSEEYEVTARFDSDRPLLEADGPEALGGADVAIDFSLPELALDHIERYAEWEIQAVIGTTGWYDELDRVRRWVAEREVGMLYAPNFSVGIALLRRALGSVLPLLDELEAYDGFIRETHHRGKVDSPSGTALAIAEEVVDGLARKARIETETQHGAIDAEDLHVSSTRAGEVVGEHEVVFDSLFDSLTFAHSAKSREGFAHGALRSAEWIRGRRGLYTLDDMFDDWLDAAN